MRASLAERRVAHESRIPDEQPASEQDEENGPDAVKIETEKTQGFEQKENANANQDHGCSRDLGDIEFLTGSKGLSQTEWIRRRLPNLDGTRGANRVDNLIHIEECERETRERWQWVALIHSHDQQHKYDEMSETFGVLTVVHCAHAKGKEAGQNSGQGRIGAALWRLG